ncbi:MAG: hypothetical protein AAGA58_14785 [Verrucomicrobiota bacterium]
MKKLILTAAATGLLGSSAFGLGFVQIDSNIAADTRWTNDNVYTLTNIIFVENGATLTIEPGTIVRAIDFITSEVIFGTSDAEVGALVVARGGKLIANGTPEQPIIFTSVDDTNVPGGSATIPPSLTGGSGTVTDGTDYGFSDYSAGGFASDNGFAYSALWGGLVILGYGHVSQNTEELDAGGDGIWDNLVLSIGAARNSGVGQDYIEGVEPGTLPPADGGVGGKSTYGGTDDDDNSGVLRFCSVRYSGFEIGAGSGNEINSLTTGGIGRGTIFEFVECNFNFDDGFEFFGGAIDTRFLFSNYIRDDSFDGDEGYRGDNQFWSVIQGNINASIGQIPSGGNGYDHGFEFDGGEPNPNLNAGAGALGFYGLPHTQLNVNNFTILGSRDAATSSGDDAFRIRELADAALSDGIVQGVQASGRTLLSTSADSVNSAHSVTLQNVHYYGDGTVDNAEDGSTSTASGASAGGTFVAGSVTKSDVTEESSRPVVSYDPYVANGVDPRQTALAPTRTDDGTTTSPSVDAGYAGFQRDNTFLSGWSQLEALGVLPASNVARPDVSVAISGGSYEISFASAGASILYVVEVSTDKRTWTPINSGATVSGAGTITTTDAGTAVTPGTTVYYRAYAL